MTPEQKVQNKIIKYFKDNNIFYEKRQAGGFNYKKGMADLWFVINGRHYEMEVKRTNGKISEMQLYQQRYLKTLGIPYYIVESFEEAKEIIDKIEN